MKRPYVNLNSGGVQPRNTGYKNPDALETVLELPVLSNGHQFANIADFETVASWKTAQASKALVPLFDAYEVTDGSTEDTFYESGNFKRRTEKGRDILNFEMYLSYCAYSALKTYEQSNYKYLFEFNQGGDYSGVFASDGVKVEGRKIKSITVERRRGTLDKVPYVIGEIVFEDKDDVLSAVLTESALTKDDLHGIYDLDIQVVSASATEVKFKLVAPCAGGATVNSVEDGDIQLLDDTGAVQSVTWTDADADGVYTLTGTGFTTGWTLDSNGVIVQTNIMYEAIEPVEITVS